jgi:plasmid stability protein
MEVRMGQLIVQGLDDRLIQALRQRAARAGRTAEAAARLRARTPPQTTNSADLIRRDRDHADPT